ncbi:MAG: hypothetical protein IJA48_07295 [Oscillospiraceae bacterium]|nr:hypothetical protein [Oscillospiraceae bacterium]
MEPAGLKTGDFSQKKLPQKRGSFFVFAELRKETLEATAARQNDFLSAEAKPEFVGLFGS